MPKRDDRGWGIHDLFPRMDLYDNGQINLSETYPGVIRAYHRHKYQTDFWRVIKGSIEVRLHTPPDYKQPLGTKKREPHEFCYLSDPSEILEIPEGIWHGFRVLGNEPAQLLYYVTNKYDVKNPDEERLAWDTFGPWETEFK